MTKKYSSFKSHQLITENWRKFLTEGEGPFPSRESMEEFEDSKGATADDSVIAWLGSIAPEGSEQFKWLQGLLVSEATMAIQALYLIDPRAQLRHDETSGTAKAFLKLLRAPASVFDEGEGSLQEGFGRGEGPHQEGDFVLDLYPYDRDKAHPAQSGHIDGFASEAEARAFLGKMQDAFPPPSGREHEQIGMRAPKRDDVLAAADSVGEGDPEWIPPGNTYVAYFTIDIPPARVIIKKLIDDTVGQETKFW